VQCIERYKGLQSSRKSVVGPSIWIQDHKFFTTQ